MELPLPPTIILQDVLSYVQKLSSSLVPSIANIAAPAAANASATLQRIAASEPQMGRIRSRLPQPSTFKSASRAADRSLHTAPTPESDSIYAESGRSATVVDVHGNAISSKSKAKTSSKKSTRKTTAGLNYDVDPPLVKHGMGDWLQQKVLTAGRTADVATDNINRLKRNRQQEVWGALAENLLVNVANAEEETYVCLHHAFTLF